MPKLIIGIDEVGRGSLAGPVLVAAACIPKNLRIPKRMGRFADSKKLTLAKRQRWYEYFKSRPDVDFELARVYPRRIERINISQAANSAALKACTRLVRRMRLKDGDYSVVLDGGLYLGHSRGAVNVKTVIKGDEKFTAVKIASIIAKVTRDRNMDKLSRKFPQYGFDSNKGYGTNGHMGALRMHGPSEVHRRTFISF